MPSPDDALSLQDAIWVLACLTAGAVDLADGVSGEQFDARALGLPMDQTVRLKDGRYVTCVLFLGDADDFNRTFG